MNTPHTVQKTPDYHLQIVEGESGCWTVSFMLRGREFATPIGRASFECAKRQAVILARQQVLRMFGGLLT